MFFSDSVSSMLSMQMSLEASIAEMTSGVNPGDVSTTTKSFVARRIAVDVAEKLDRDALPPGRAASARRGLARRTRAARGTRSSLSASSVPGEIARSWIVVSGRTPMHSATSPNWRSRSMTATRLSADASADGEIRDVVTVLPVPPFGPSTQIIEPLSGPARRRHGAPAGDHLLQGEPHALGRLRQANDVVGAHLEQPAEEAVGRRLDSTTIGQFRVLARRAADERERPLGIPGARDHEQIRRRSCSVAQLSSTPWRKPTIWIEWSLGRAARTAASSIPVSSETSARIGRFAIG